MPAQQQAAPPPERRAIATRSSSELSIDEMTRVMDVAATLRRERTIAEQQLNIDQTKQMLREKLREAARVTGDPVTDAEIDAAIEHYYENLHEFEPPESNFETLMAHVYVARGTIAKWTFAIGTATAAVWWAMQSGLF